MPNITFRKEKCPKCGNMAELRINNNPLLGTAASCPVALCFDCLAKRINFKDLDKVDFFCRTYNIPFKPDLWISLADKVKTPPELFKTYVTVVLNDESGHPSLYCNGQTHDLWLKTTKEWAKVRTFGEILKRLDPLRESYTERGRLKWGDQYAFEELLQLDSIYTSTLKANNVTNPLQKEAVKTLCKLQLRLNEAIRDGDSNGIKNYSTAWGTFAKQADLETRIAETHTSDITNVAELSDYLERTGFQPRFYDGFPKDEVDNALKDISSTIKRTINESTSIQPMLEEMVRKKAESKEKQETQKVTDATTLQDLINFSADDVNEEIQTEDDADVVNNVDDFKNEPSSDVDNFVNGTVHVSHAESKQREDAMKPSNSGGANF